uniref:Lipase domain-containing protein n=1 Tax=Glossina brevipalpis TaxID=37001 RepID=A0A1A9WIK7_9MUSC
MYADIKLLLRLFTMLPLLTLVSQFCESHRAIAKLLHQNSIYQSDNDRGIVTAVRESMREYKRAAKGICYGELGCFETTKEFEYLDMLPSPPEEIDTKFYFYSTKNRSDRPLMELPFLNMTTAFRSLQSTNRKRSTSVELQSTETPNLSTTSLSTLEVLKKVSMTLDEFVGFDEMSVRIIVHGFGSACSHEWVYEMKTALMAVEDCIVICVDWEKGANLPNYVRAATNTRLVGKQLAMLIKNLKDHKGLKLSRTHIIGFSLGAHVSGFAGSELPGLARITGLDPAGPLFEAQHPTVRLDGADAEFVDVIHSNGENLIRGGLGSWQAMGHVDFYPNGGRAQTGCSNLFVGAVTDFIWPGQQTNQEEGRSLCNHRRAYKFFIDSVAPRCMFPAFPCATYEDFLKGLCFSCPQTDDGDMDVSDRVPRCGNMGYYADRSPGRGQLYLVTRDEEPFCAHQFLLQIYNSFSYLPLRTIGRLEATLEGDVGLNETFKITEKDDSEFFAAEIISKIIVPHPALGFPNVLTLNYKQYSGWLSKGLHHWDIDKVVLTDTFGRSHSLCRPSISLISNSPMRMILQPGNCKLDNQDEYGISTSKESTNISDSSAQESVHLPQLHLKLKENRSFELSSGGDLPWQPIIEGNSLDKESTETSRSLSFEQEEIFEPVLNEKRLAVNRGRNLQDYPVTDEIMEPLLKATTPKIRKETTTTVSEPSNSRINQMIAVINKKKSETNNALPGTITVQLFPLRLGELLEKAERYAKEKLLPLISVQAPKLFGFNFNKNENEDNPKLNNRKARYIPRFEEQTFKKNNSDISVDKKTKKSEDLITVATSEQKNIFKLTRERDTKLLQLYKGSERAVDSSNKITYYTSAVSTVSPYLKADDAEYQPVFIELPTYRPPKSKSSRSSLFSSSSSEENLKTGS